MDFGGSHGYDQVFVDTSPHLMDSITRADARKKMFGDMTQKFEEIAARETQEPPDRVSVMRKLIRDQVRREIEASREMGVRGVEGLTVGGQPDFMMILLIVLIVFCAISHMKVFALSTELRRIRNKSGD